MVIEKIVDTYYKDPAVYYFNMYRSMDKAGFWTRLKWAWRYFRQGEFAYSDMTVETQDIDRMIKFFEEALKEAKI